MDQWVVPGEAWVRGRSTPHPPTSGLLSRWPVHSLLPIPQRAWGRMSSAPRTAVTWLGPPLHLLPRGAWFWSVFVGCIGAWWHERPSFRHQECQDRTGLLLYPSSERPGRGHHWENAKVAQRWLGTR